MNLQDFLNQLLDEAKKINIDKVKEAVTNAAETIFGKADPEKVEQIVNSAVKLGKDTEDAIQIGINMMRGRK